MDPLNFLLITSDEHTRRAMGCYRHPLVKTPNLDRLAAMGSVFENAYSNSPLCVPSRSSFATGLYPHQIGCWDNCHGWDGSIPGWTHRAKSAGVRTAAIGKLHYQRTGKLGLDEEILPMHLSNSGLGDGIGLLRKQEVPFRSPEKDFGLDAPIAVSGPKMMADAVGRGESNHIDYDRRITQAAVRWLRENGKSNSSAPWALHVSFVAPHFPLIAPPEFYDLYPLDRISWPIQYAESERPTHPVIRALSRIWNYDDYFTDEKMLRARAAYFGLCSFLDHNVGLVLEALRECGAFDRTRIIYTSDHGECLGNRGIWSTSAMYEESVGVPMILCGPEVPRGQRINDVVSLVDLFPTIIQSVGASIAEDERRPGASLVDIAGGYHPSRVVLSEYHAGGSITGSFMIRNGDWKYVYYVGFEPQLFDLGADPDELVDLGQSPAHAQVRSDCERLLRTVVDPEAVDRSAFLDQAQRIEQHGGIDAILRRTYTWGGHAIDTRIEADGSLTQLTELPPFERVLGGTP